MRESAQAWAESYPAMDYRHGPIAVAGAKSLVWIFGDAAPGPGRRRSRRPVPRVRDQRPRPVGPAGPGAAVRGRRGRGPRPRPRPPDGVSPDRSCSPDEPSYEVRPAPSHVRAARVARAWSVLTASLWCSRGRSDPPGPRPLRRERAESSSGRAPYTGSSSVPRVTTARRAPVPTRWRSVDEAVGRLTARRGGAAAGGHLRAARDAARRAPRRDPALPARTRHPRRWAADAPAGTLGDGHRREQLPGRRTRAWTSATTARPPGKPCRSGSTSTAPPRTSP